MSEAPGTVRASFLHQPGRNKARSVPGKARRAAGEGRDRRGAGSCSRQRVLLIEHLHLIQDTYGQISAEHFPAAPADLMALAFAEVFETATFYAHFDVVKRVTPPSRGSSGLVSATAVTCAMFADARAAGRCPAGNSGLRRPRR